MKNKKFKRILSGLLCAAFIVCQTLPVLATDEYGDPIVTATPVPGYRGHRLRANLRY